LSVKPGNCLSWVNTLGVLTDPRTLVPGMPFAADAGLRATF